MNILDIIFLVVVCLLMLRGLYRGIIVESASLVGLVLGFWLAKLYAPVLAPYIERGISTPGWAPVIAYLLIFLGVTFLITLGAKAMKSVLTITFAVWIDSIFGGVMGLVKGILFCCFALALFQTFMPNANFLHGSLFAPWFDNVTDFFKQFLDTTTL